MTSHDVALLVYGGARRQIDAGLSPRPAVVASTAGQWNGTVILAPQAVGETAQTWRDVGSWLAGLDADAAWVISPEETRLPVPVPEGAMGALFLAGVAHNGKTCCSYDGWERSKGVVCWTGEHPGQIADGPMADGITGALLAPSYTFKLSDEDMRAKGHEVITSACEECGTPGSDLVDVPAGKRSHRFTLCASCQRLADDGRLLECVEAAGQ